jgi:hypothetical protein
MRVPTLLPVEGRPEPDVYIVTEFMESDLFKVIQDQSLGIDHVQSFVYQMLCALQVGLPLAGHREKSKGD